MSRSTNYAISWELFEKKQQQQKVPIEKKEAVTATSSNNGTEKAHELPQKFPYVSQYYSELVCFSVFE